MTSQPISPNAVLSVRDLSIDYKAARGKVQAVRNVSFELNRGEVLALIGESGSGKTTVSLGLVRLLPVNASISGKVAYQRLNSKTGERKFIDVLDLSSDSLRQFRWAECAMVFQSALNALNPVLKISEQFGDTASAHGYLRGKALQERSAHLLNLVRLDPDRVWKAYPHELSGGMRQRVVIALSLLLEPQVIIMDEPTTALDILTQRNIMDVLNALRKELDFSLIFISHDLSLAAELADRVATMYAGRLVEISTVQTIFKNPHHPYTIGLINAVPTLEGTKDDLISIPGQPPDLISLPAGCKFHPRCPLVEDRCRKQEPNLEEIAPNHSVACWRWREARAALKAFEALNQRAGGSRSGAR
jgi:peptide/nickel transport system ATP-binding protein